MQKKLLYILLILLLLVNYDFAGNIKIISATNEGQKIKLVVELENELWLKRISANNNFTKQGTERIKPDYGIDLFINIVEEPVKVNYRIIKRSQIEVSSSFYVEPEEMKLPLKVKGSFVYKGKKYLHLKLYPAFISGRLNVIGRIELSLIYKNSRTDANYFVDENFLRLKNNKATFKQTVEDNSSWIDFNSDYVKIGVAADGIYRIMKSDLEFIGINTMSINPKKFKIFLRGNEIPIFVEGEEDGVFDDSDYIEFAAKKNYGGHHREISPYGKPYNEYLNRYTDTSYYFLTWNTQNGKRVIISEYSLAADTIDYYYETSHYEKDNWFDFSMSDLIRREMPFWYENKTWNEGQLGVGTASRNFSIDNLYPGKTVKGFVKFQDYASNVVESAHKITVSINDLPEGDTVVIDKYQKGIASVSYSSDEINSSTASLKIHSYNTNAVLNAILLDWFEIEYPRYLKAKNDSLKFVIGDLFDETFHNLKITNLSDGSITLWKLGDRIRKFNFKYQSGELIFSDTVNLSDVYFLTASERVLKPKFFYFGKIKDLNHSNNQADYIIITNKKFLSLSNEYAQFIESTYNLNATVIDIDNIYDVYSYGYFNPEAIKSFLMSAYNYWSEPKPEYCFLIGEATYDYHGNKNKYQGYPEVKNYVPSYGASVSDNWFVVWDSTGAFLPQMKIGRIAVNSNDELQRYLEKHSNYIDKKYDAWNKTFLFLSGGTGDNQAQLDQLREVNEFIIDNYASPAPVGGRVNHFYKTLNPNTNFGPFNDEEIQNAFDQGAVFISYIGHSGTRTWDNSITDPYQLKNKFDYSPLVTDFGCSTGRFAEPDVVSFSELFTLSEEGQAIAYVGNSSLGFLSTAVSVPKIFYRNLLVDTLSNICQALNEAKMELLRVYGASSVNRLFALTNTYFGDPVLNLPIPLKPNLAVSESDIFYSPEQPSDNIDSLIVSLKYFNFGKVTTETFSVEVIHIYNDSITDTLRFKRTPPLFVDSLEFAIPIKNMPGVHYVYLSLDTDDNIDELFEDDNRLNAEVNVVSSAFRTFLSYNYANSVMDTLLLLNPPSDTNAGKVVLQIDESTVFTSPLSQEFQLDTVITKVPLSSLLKGKRYFIRTRSATADVFSRAESFIKTDQPFKFYAADSLSFAGFYLDRMKIKNGSLVIKNDSIKFEILSAGFNDGNTAVIMKNNVNYIPENTLRGHHICLFDTSNFEFVKYVHFDLLGGGSQEVQSYINFLDTLSAEYYVLFAISDEGRVSSSALREKIKLFGSKYIDQVGFRYSWAMIGLKGASPILVPEAFSAPSSGSVKIDSIIVDEVLKGKFSTPLIGTSDYWHKLFVNISPDAQSLSELNIITYGVGTIDTLTGIQPDANGNIDLSFLNDSEIKTIKIIGVLNRQSVSFNAALTEIGVEYKYQPDLATSYKMFALSKDTVMQGDSLSVRFGFMNVGESTSDSFSVKLYLIDNGNQETQLAFFNLPPLPSGQRFFDKYLFADNYLYGSGKMYFKFIADAENSVPEYYEDNNEFILPFYLEKDTLTNIASAEVSVAVNGEELFDGDVINNKPLIEIKLNYKPLFNYSDTSTIKIFLDGNKYFIGKMDSISFDTVNREALYSFRPILSSGKHTLAVSGKNLYGNLSNASGYSVWFNVSDELEIRNAYNYPNPMKDDTYFIFALTDLPEELTVKIFTVAGRLVKTIYAGNSLNYNTNKLYWDGKDEDGDQLASGVYFYKIIAKQKGKTVSIIQKLAIVR